MKEQRILDMMEKMWSIAAARQPVDAIFNALKLFEGKAQPFNRHLASPSPTPEEWTGIYAQVEPYAEELSQVLEVNRDSFSVNLMTGLDGTAGLINEAAAYGIDTRSIMRQFGVMDVVGMIDRVPSKLNVFLYSWGRPSLKEYRGEQMQLAVEHASYIEREASYFANYLNRLFNRSVAQ